MNATEPMTTHQKVIVAILAFLQFTVIVDFMILAPLGALLMDELQMDTKQFGFCVSAAAMSAGASSFASAAFADRFDRKKLLLFFYVGFIIGTGLCGVAPSYEVLLGARIMVGVFGGVLGSMSMAIIADVFPLTMRGRVMGTVMTSLSAAQIAGVPAGLLLSNAWGWHAPFLVIAGIGAVVGVGIAFGLGPLDAHLQGATAARESPFKHVLHTATEPAHLGAFATTILLASGFMVMPLFSAYFVNNLHVTMEELPLVFLITGAFTFFIGPLAGKLADSIGKLAVFTIGSLLAAVVYGVWATLSSHGAAALWIVVAANALMYGANTARMVSAGSLMSAVPAPADRGAFMSINTSLQQATGGVAAAVGGLIVVTQPDGTLARFDTACWIIVGLVLAVVVPMWRIDRQVKSTRT